MAWNTITDVNDGQPFGGTNYQEVQDAIAQLQAAAGTDENKIVKRIAQVSSPTGNVNFTSIPQTFQHLLLEISGNHDDASSANAYRAVSVRFNGDSGSNYQCFSDYVDQTGSQTIGSVTVSQTAALLGYMGDVNSTLTARISNYTGANRKTIDSWGTAAIGGLWTNGVRRFHSSSEWINNTAASSLTVIGFAGDDWAAGTTLTLYGLP